MTLPRPKPMHICDICEQPQRDEFNERGEKYDFFPLTRPRYE